MLEPNQSLLPKPDLGKRLSAGCIGFETESLEELMRLLDTLGVEVGARFEAQVRKPNPATYLGRGKLEEVAQTLAEQQLDVLVVDTDLSPNQLKNIEKVVGKTTLDRAAVILEIFSQHARTREAKTQVELARLEYLMPRLAHYWTHFERQRGGIGLKGMGETQIEVDRRLLKKRMQMLRGRLKEIEKERGVQREGRKDVMKVALVGYTNAGKSTLLNALTQSRVLTEDKLFSTLDSCVRALDPDCHPPVVAIDTVGFISRIPTTLVASFRSTLEEVVEADLLLHVVDASSPQASEQIETTVKVLEELGVANKPRMLVLNKCDQIRSTGDLNRARMAAPGAPRVSAFNPAQVAALRDKILDHFRDQLEVWEVVIPYDETRVEAQIRRYGYVERTKYLEKGIFCRAKIDPVWAGKLGLERYRL